MKLVLFASNQTLVDNGTASAITTDPVAVGTHNRATGVTNIHSIFGAAGAGLSWQMQGSMDGQTWFAMGPAQAIPLAAEGLFEQPATGITVMYARLAILFISTPLTIGATTFDIYVTFDFP